MPNTALPRGNLAGAGQRLHAIRRCRVARFLIERNARSSRKVSAASRASCSFVKMKPRNNLAECHSASG